MSQYTEVKRICDDLERSGKAVSLDYVLSRASDAQASVVSHYKKWRNEQLLAQSQDKLPGFSDDFIQAFRQEALKQTQQQTAQLTKQLAEAIQAEVKAVEQLQYQQHSLQQLALHKAELEQNLATQQQQLARQADTFAELTTERDHLRQEVQQLQGQLTTQQYHLQQSQQEQQQTQAQLTQLQQDLTKLQQDAAQQQAEDKQRLQQLTEQYELLRKRSAEQQRQHFESNQQVHRQLADYAAQCAELTSERDALQTQLTPPNLLTSEAQAITADANNNHSEQAYTALQQDYAAQASYIAELKQQIALLTITPHSDSESADSGQLTDLVAERDQAIAAAAAHAHEVQELKQELQRLNTIIHAPDADSCNDIAQLRTTIALLRHQSALTANHQAEQRELIKQLRDELALQREQVQKIQVERYQWAKQKLQLEEQVNFVKSNSAATIERLTRYREQAQERIEQLEQQLRAS